MAQGQLLLAVLVALGGVATEAHPYRSYRDDLRDDDDQDASNKSCVVYDTLYECTKHCLPQHCVLSRPRDHQLVPFRSIVFRCCLPFDAHLRL